MGDPGDLGAATATAPATSVVGARPVDEVPGTGARSRIRSAWRPWAPTLVAVAACIGLLGLWQVAFFAEHHPIIDHVAYRAQAEQLLDGNLTMPADADAPSWAVRFTAETDHGRVFKYLPGTAALGAASLWLTGDVGLALVASLALVVIATSGIGATLGWSAGRRAVAGFLVGASPVVLSQASVLLSYVPTLALTTTAVWLVLLATGTRTATDPTQPTDPMDPIERPAPTAPSAGPTGLSRRSLALFAGAGLLLGLALLVRQIEVVAVAVVLAGWCLLRTDVPARGRVLRTGVLLVATVPGVVLVMLVNHHVTGSATEFPFTLVSPDDGMGWGLRRVLPSDALERFGILDGLRTTPRATFDLVMWTLVGPALAVGAAVALWVRRRSPVHWLLAALGLVIPVAYLFHWANAHAVWAGFYMNVGAFYYLACVPPLVLLGVDGLARLPRRVVVVAVVVVVAAQTLFLADHLRAQWDHERASGSSTPATAPATAPETAAPTVR